MKDVQTVLEAYRTAVLAQIPCALATVVSVDGSAYRRPGARMLVYADGRRFGSLSGGCLEADVAAHALRTLETGRPATVRYDPNAANGDVVLETGCKGTIVILVEPVTAGEAGRALDFVSTVVGQRQTGIMATVFHVEGTPGLQVGDRLMVTGDRTMVAGALTDSPLADVLRNVTTDTRYDAKTCVRTYLLPEGSAHVLLEILLPPIALVICGSGHDTAPLAKMASALGWQVAVADPNGSALTPERFPEGATLLPIRPACLTAYLIPDQRTAAVVMTHRYAVDLDWFRELLPTPMKYLGVLGPRRRWHQMQIDLAAGGDVFPEDALARVHSPAGLDIGSETPEEIALAIVAEIQSVMAARNGGFLRNREIAIHSGEEESGALPSLSVQAGSVCAL